MPRMACGSGWAMDKATALFTYCLLYGPHALDEGPAIENCRNPLTEPDYLQR